MDRCFRRREWELVDPVVQKKVQTRLKDYYERELTKVPFAGWDPEFRHMGMQHERFIPPTLIRHTPVGGMTRYIEVDDYQQMFIPNHEDRTPGKMLLSGSAGCGKTTLAHRLALQWAAQDLDAEDLKIPYNALFLIRGGAIIKDSTVTKIIQDQLLQGMDLTEEDVVNLIQSQQKKICIVIDGYEQYVKGTSKEFEELHMRKRMLSVTVVTFARRNRMPLIKSYVDKMYVFMSFNEGRQEQYVAQYFQESPETGKQLLEVMKKRELCQVGKNPLLLFAICRMFKLNGCLPDTLTSLYSQMFEFTYKRESTMQKLSPIQDMYRVVGRYGFVSLCRGDKFFEIPADDRIFDEAISISLLDLYHYILRRSGTRHARFSDSSVHGFAAAQYLFNNDDHQMERYENYMQKNLLNMRHLLRFIPGMEVAGVPPGPSNMAKVPLSLLDKAEKVLRYICELITKPPWPNRGSLKLDRILFCKWGSANPEEDRTDFSKLWEMAVEAHHAIGLTAFNRADLWCGQTFYYVVGDKGSAGLVRDELKYIGVENDKLQEKEGYKISSPVLVDIRGDSYTTIRYLSDKHNLQLDLQERPLTIEVNLRSLTVLYLSDLQLDAKSLFSVMQIQLKVIYLLRLEVSEPASKPQKEWSPSWQFMVLENGVFPRDVARALARAIIQASQTNLGNLDIWGSSLQETQDLWKKAPPSPKLTSVLLGGNIYPAIAEWVWKGKNLQHCRVELDPGVNLTQWSWPKQLRVLDIGGVCSMDQLVKLLPRLAKSNLSTLGIGELSSSKDPKWTTERITQAFMENPFPRFFSNLRVSLGHNLSPEESEIIGKALHHKEVPRRWGLFRRLELENVHHFFMKSNEQHREAVMKLVNMCLDSSHTPLVIAPFLGEKWSLLSHLPDDLHKIKHVEVTEKKLRSLCDFIPTCDNVWPEVFAQRATMNPNAFPCQHYHGIW